MPDHVRLGTKDLKGAMTDVHDIARAASAILLWMNP